VLLEIGFAGNREMENSITLLCKEHIQEIMKRHISPRVISLSKCGSVFSSRRENFETDLGSEVIMLYRFDVHAKEKYKSSGKRSMDQGAPCFCG